MEFMQAPLKGVVDRVAQGGSQRSGRAGKVAIAAGAGEDGVLLRLARAVAQHQDPAALGVDQGRKLREHALGQPLHRLESNSVEAPSMIISRPRRVATMRWSCW
jgi:hypothetical protein